MKITTWKRAVLLGVASAAATTLWCIIFTFVTVSLTGKIFFSNIGPPPEKEINDILNIVALVSAIIVSAFISAIILRYNSAKFLKAYLPVRIATYATLLFAVYFSIAIIDDFFGRDSNVSQYLENSPLNSWDYFVYALYMFPAGFAIGTIIAIVINTIKNHKENK